MEFTKALVAQLRAIDTYNHWGRMSDEELIDKKYIKKKGSGATANCHIKDEQALFNIKMFFQTIATEFERETGELSNVMMEFSDEGFGRVVVIAGKIVIVDKSIRDANSYGFKTVEKLEIEGAKMYQKALDIYNKYKQEE